MSEKAVFYIDGFNLYFGLRDSGWRRFYWLDVNLLSHHCILPGSNQVLKRVRYYTARISTPEDKVQRQKNYLEALETLDNTDIVYGKYLGSTVTCRSCGSAYVRYNEKMTDVNIAVDMIFDAFGGVFDVAYLVTGDSDLAPVIEKIRAFFPEKKIIVYFPPNRSSKKLKNICHTYRSIFRKTLELSQFPDELSNNLGYIIKRPEKWR